MNITTNGFTALSIFLSLTGLHAHPRHTDLAIEVHIYNYSTIAAEMVEGAQHETARIFERIGIATTWLNCPINSQEAIRNRTCAIPDTPTRLTLRLLSNSMADSFGGGGDIFGSAILPANGGFGVVANVYADRMTALADGREFEATLGRVIAHELGHLLLGKNAHSPAGIMRAHWRVQDLTLTQAVMSFLPSEAKRIRVQITARIRLATIARGFFEAGGENNGIK